LCNKGFTFFFFGGILIGFFNGLKFFTIFTDNFFFITRLIYFLDEVSNLRFNGVIKINDVISGLLQLPLSVGSINRAIYPAMF